MEWFKPTQERKESIVVYTGEMKSGRRQGAGVALDHGANRGEQFVDLRTLQHVPDRAVAR